MSREDEIRRQRARMQQRYESRDSSGGSSKPNYIDFNKLGGYKKEIYYKLKEDLNNLDILPYRIKTNHHIDKLPIGDTDYVLEIYVHRNIVGPNNGSCICLEKMYNLPCPICDERREREKDPTENPKELGKLWPQHRVIYNVLDLDAKGEPEIQILDMSYKKFEKPLRTQAAVSGEIIIFHDPKIGKTVQVRGEPDSFYSEKEKRMIPYTAPTRFDFIDRKPYPDNIADSTYSLDDILVVPSSEEIRNMYYGYDTPAEAPQEARREEPLREEAPTPASENPFANRGKREVSGDTGGASISSSASTVQEQPISRERHRERSVPPAGVCPYNHEFGRAIGNHPECNQCDDNTWKACDAKAKELGV